MKTICSWRLPGRRPPRRMLENLVRAAAETAETGDCPVVSVVFLKGPDMAELNREALNHKGSTDVISFDLRTPGLPPDDSGDVPGIELYICPEVAAREAAKRNLPYSREVTLYIVHGFLHMAGEDDLNPAAKRRMRRAEKRVMAVLEKKFNFERIFGTEFSSASVKQDGHH